MTSKRIIANHTKGEKLDGLNYDIWHRKVYYFLYEQKLLEIFINSLEKDSK